MVSEHAAWELGHAAGYDDSQKTDCGRADVLKSQNPFHLPEAEPDEEVWFYARHRDDERWELGGSREEAIAQALSDAEPGDVRYVVLGIRPTTEQFAAGSNADWILDLIIDKASDDGLLGEDSELEWVDVPGLEAELQAVIVRHLTRPRWWCCDGSQAEEITAPDHGQNEKDE